MGISRLLIILVDMSNIRNLLKWVFSSSITSIIDFSQYQQETRPGPSAMFSPPSRYTSAPYQPSYYETRGYPVSTEPRSYDPTQLPSASYPEFTSAHSVGPYSGYAKEPEPAKTSPTQFSYGVGFSNSPYAGFYHEASYGIFIDGD